MRSRLLIALAALVLMAPVASADTMNVFGTGANADWSKWTTASQNGAMFWDRPSYDGNNCNVGYWLSGQGNCTHPDWLPSPKVTPDFLGTGNTPFSFNGTGQPVTVTMHIQIAGMAPDSSFGWFDANGMYELFKGFNGGKKATFVPNGEYGFYISTPYSLFGSNLTDGSGRAHFAAFRLSGSHYFLGLEDMASSSTFPSDFDYQDMAVELNFSEVPEPASMLLLGTGLLGIGAARRRRRQQQQ